MKQKFALLFLLGAFSVQAQINAKLMRHLDISDTQIVFVYGGDLWIMPKAGGLAVQITHSPGEESYPKFSPDVTRKYTVADMITGYGVAEAVRHFYATYGGDIKGKKAIVLGFGNVGSAAAFYLAEMGAKVIGIIDRDGGLIKEEGFSFEEIRTLFLNKDGNKLVADNMIPFEEINSKIWTIGAQIFTPCAASR